MGLSDYPSSGDFWAVSQAGHAFEVPDTSGVKLHDILTVFLNGFGGIDHVVNDTGAAVNASNQVVNIVNYP